MERASGHHSRRFSPLSRQALRAAALAAVAVAAAAAVAATAPQSHFSGHAAKTAEKEFSPYRATEDVSIGKFYLRKGRYDAAISRFQGAVQHDPRWATPHRYLGEAYEKKGDPRHAIAEYREYLKIRPSAKDAKKIEKRIADLSREIQVRDESGR